MTEKERKRTITEFFLTRWYRLFFIIKNIIKNTIIDIITRVHIAFIFHLMTIMKELKKSQIEKRGK
jgi:hypothetical protein